MLFLWIVGTMPWDPSERSTRFIATFNVLRFHPALSPPLSFYYEPKCPSIRSASPKEENTRWQTSDKLEYTQKGKVGEKRDKLKAIIAAHGIEAEAKHAKE
jgi:hypothetical protein